MSAARGKPPVEVNGPGGGDLGPRRKRRREGVGLRPPPLLQDMRWVYEHAEREDWTPAQKHCRAWLKEDCKEFMRELAALEKAWSRAVAQAPTPKARRGAGAEAKKVDEGTERAGRTLLEFLTQLKKQVEEETARVTARPGTA